MIFLVVLWGKMIFLFPQNMILFLRRKIKDDLFFKKKKKWKYDILFKCPEKWSFHTQKNRAGIWSFLYYLERLFFFGKYDIFSLDGKWKMIFPKRNMEIWYFLYICTNVTNMILRLCKKIRDDLLPKKFT